MKIMGVSVTLIIAILVAYIVGAKYPSLYKKVAGAV